MNARRVRMGVRGVRGGAIEAIEALEARTLLATAPFTVVALTDSQYYVENFPATYDAQMRWIADNKAALNVAFVHHQGDLLRRGYSSAQVATAQAGFAHLEAAGIPYGVSIGNHDFDNQFDDLDRHVSSASFTAAFGAPRLAGVPLSGADLRGHNTYQIISAGGRQFLMINLEWEAPDPAIAWAQSVIDQHRHLPVILSTHEYLRGTSRTTSPLDPAANSGQAIWNKLVRLNPQIFMVLSGHTGTEYHLTSTNNAGSAVFELAADYEGRANGGSGWLQYMTFDPDAGAIHVRTYSPTLDQFETDSTSQFTLPMNFATRLSFAPAGVPIANDDVVDTLPGQAVVGSVVANDYEPDGQALSASLVSGPANGTLALLPDGTFTYTPNPDFRGIDSFKYTVTDGVTGTSNQATVTLRVNTAPVGTADAILTPQDTAITVDVVANDVDADAADVLRPILTSLPPHGAVYANADGTFTYTPDPKFVGTDSFTYRVTDGKVASEPVTVTVTVRPNRPVYDYPISETTPIGTRLNGSNFTATFDDDEGAEEVIREAISDGISQLDHRWTFNVTGGSEVVFVIRAKRSYGLNEYQLDYSTNGGSSWSKFQRLVTASSLDVTRTNYDADEPYQMWLMPASTRGTVIVRVTETNGSDLVLDTFTVDEVFIRSATVFPTVSIARVADAAEGGAPATFVVTRAGSTLNAIDVAWSLGGTASAADHVPVSGIVTLPAGAASATVSVTAIADGLVEGEETLVATILPGDAYDVATAAASAVIADGGPTDLAATAGGSYAKPSVALAWTDTTVDEEGFVVERSADGGASWAQVASVAAGVTQYTDLLVAGDTTYRYRVVAFAADGTLVSAASNVAVVTTAAPPDMQAPTAPANLAVTSASTTTVSLAWTASTDDVGVVAYDVYRDGALAGSTVGTTYTDAALTPGATYVYTVTARDASGKVSSPSDAVPATTLVTRPAAPTQLKAGKPKGSKVTLSWRDQSADEDGFHVWSSRDGVNWTLYSTVPGKSGGNANISTTTSSLAGGAWYFRVTSFLDGVDSDPSNVVSVTV